jgi:hypothetical protein
MSVREACVAGLFYPEDKIELKEFIRKTVESTSIEYNNPKAVIVPHAGYIYSGHIAAKAFRQLGNNNKIKKILLMGPSHRVSIRGVVLADSEFFETPLGRIPVNGGICDKLLENSSVQVNPEAHRYEHSIEVQLPFLQYIFKDNLEIIPVLTNNASPYLINSILEPVWNDIDNFVISTDLSHYLSYKDAIQKDNKTCELIEKLEYKSLDEDDACGLAGVKGLLLTLLKKNMKIKCIDKCNSGDSGSNKNRVVGYAAFCSI